MELIRNEETKIKTEYRFTNDTGDAQVDVYHVFPGIEVAYVALHMANFDFSAFEGAYRKDYVGFHYCAAGRIEQAIDNEFIYLMPGDLSVTAVDKNIKLFNFPLNHYHGLSIGVDKNAFEDSFSCLLGDVSISPDSVVEKICSTHHTTVLRSCEKVGQILETCFNIPEEQRTDYLKIKIIEFLYVLSQTDAKAYLTESSVSRSQAEYAKQIADYISINIQNKMTIRELTEKFAISETHLQRIFRSVYGMPVISFIRAQKMQCAAQVLIHTTRSIDDIADEFGYVNESKFSAVFKKVMGDTPSIYRKEHSKVKIL
ncbi:MAG: AraC family transcriptional regulator [Frisingicoccus sp.]|nr:AraC family transcriptional regulator [Frisingicoccus sp.]